MSAISQRQEVFSVTKTLVGRFLPCSDLGKEVVHAEESYRTTSAENCRRQACEMALSTLLHVTLLASALIVLGVFIVKSSNSDLSQFVGLGSIGLGSALSLAFILHAIISVQRFRRQEKERCDYVIDQLPHHRESKPLFDMVNEPDFSQLLIGSIRGEFEELELLIPKARINRWAIEAIPLDSWNEFPDLVAEKLANTEEGDLIAFKTGIEATLRQMATLSRIALMAHIDLARRAQSNPILTLLFQTLARGYIDETIHPSKNELQFFFHFAPSDLISDMLIEFCPSFQSPLTLASKNMSSILRFNTSSAKKQVRDNGDQIQLFDENISKVARFCCEALNYMPQESAIAFLQACQERNVNLVQPILKEFQRSSYPGIGEKRAAIFSQFGYTSR